VRGHVRGVLCEVTFGVARVTKGRWPACLEVDIVYCEMCTNIQHCSLIMKHSSLNIDNCTLHIAHCTLHIAIEHCSLMITIALHIAHYYVHFPVSRSNRRLRAGCLARARLGLSCCSATAATAARSRSTRRASAPASTTQ
jgi:hypothetical protein